MSKSNVTKTIQKFIAIQNILDSADRPMRAGEIAKTAKVTAPQVARFWNHSGPVGVLCAMRRIGIAKRIKIGTEVVALPMWNDEVLMKEVPVFGWVKA